jgi:hypothetical protein
MLPDHNQQSLQRAHAMGKKGGRDTATLPDFLTWCTRRASHASSDHASVPGPFRPDLLTHTTAATAAAAAVPVPRAGWQAPPVPSRH